MTAGRKRLSVGVSRQRNRHSPKNEQVSRLPNVLAAAGNTAISQAVQRRPAKEKKGTSIGVLKIDGLPDLKVLSAVNWGVKRSTNLMHSGGEKFPQLEPAAIHVGNLEVEVPYDAAIEAWFDRIVRKGSDEEKSGALHLTKPGKGGALPAGSIDLKDVAPIKLTKGGPSLKLELAVEDFRITGTADKVPAKSTDHLNLGAGWDPIPLQSFKIDQRTEVIKEAAPSFFTQLKAGGPSAAQLEVRVAMGPWIDRLSSLSKVESLRIEVVKVGGQTIATFVDALVSEVDVSASSGGAPSVKVAFVAEQMKRGQK